MAVISRSDMEQILVRNLPVGTKAALRARAKQHGRPLEAEVREILAEASQAHAQSLAELLWAAPDIVVEVDFEPSRLGLTARSAEL